MQIDFIIITTGGDGPKGRIGRYSTDLLCFPNDETIRKALVTLYCPTLRTPMMEDQVDPAEIEPAVKQMIESYARGRKLEKKSMEEEVEKELARTAPKALEMIKHFLKEDFTVPTTTRYNGFPDKLRDMVSKRFEHYLRNTYAVEVVKDDRGDWVLHFKLRIPEQWWLY